MGDPHWSQFIGPTYSPTVTAMLGSISIDGIIVISECLHENKERSIHSYILCTWLSYFIAFFSYIQFATVKQEPNGNLIIL